MILRTPHRHQPRWLECCYSFLNLLYAYAPALPMAVRPRATMVSLRLRVLNMADPPGIVDGVIIGPVISARVRRRKPVLGRLLNAEVVGGDVDGRDQPCRRISRTKIQISQRPPVKIVRVMSTSRLMIPYFFIAVLLDRGSGHYTPCYFCETKKTLSPCKGALGFIASFSG